MNGNRIVSIDMTPDDYVELLDLLRCCSEVCARHSEIAYLVADFRYMCELFEKNRR